MPKDNIVVFTHDSAIQLDESRSRDQSGLLISVIRIDRPETIIPAGPAPAAAIIYDFTVKKNPGTGKKPGSVADPALRKIVSTDEYSILLLANILRTAE
jgi:hypothetical protein